ncbi:unnamed protein product [Vitrella brassicaformis CCMP3155]|uniref:Uncharacterized protein n=1 Tax=Vitrella brassicaformis (strain CCMP3155) TaxID=1169540 RepID=A0A0G4ELC4_VITBC|nr:unnamed protein product [Vitrella brassicaformis CCMP3155]|eukprot:CEL97752.1 unnamed protein product [Vitrella brassicaformis CCMP3155]
MPANILTTFLFLFIFLAAVFGVDEKVRGARKRPHHDAEGLEAVATQADDGAEEEESRPLLSFRLTHVNITGLDTMAKRLSFEWSVRQLLAASLGTVQEHQILLQPISYLPKADELPTNASLDVLAEIVHFDTDNWTWEEVVSSWHTALENEHSPLREGFSLDLSHPTLVDTPTTISTASDEEDSYISAYMDDMLLEVDEAVEAEETVPPEVLLGDT